MRPAPGRPSDRYPPMQAGQIYGKLEAIEFLHIDKHRCRVWRFRCHGCGNENFSARAYIVQRGDTTSCNCHRRAVMAVANLKHGKWKTSEFKIWGGMIDRCTNENSPSYPGWGGLGVTICERWRHNFENFLADMGLRPSPKHSIDRHPNPFGNYEPTNCRWATWTEQARNRRNNRIVQVGGREMTFTEACSLAGMPYSTVHNRLRRGWTLERALAEPAHSNNGKKRKS
jgi:hypothetical protein